MKGMLVTIGTGNGVHLGIKDAIAAANPEALVCFGTAAHTMLREGLYSEA